MTNKQLLDRVAVITGGSSGIGESIAHRFAEEGARVIISSRDLSRCEQVAKSILATGATSLALACDVTKEQHVIELFDQAEAAFAQIDIVVANAGISGGSDTVDQYSLEQWNRVIATNLTGVFLTVREAFRRMKPRGGHIIVMSSQAGVEGYAGKGAYCATKFGIRGLAHALAEEGRKCNINVSALCPGTVDTPILAASNTKVKHPMTREAVADAAVFLASLRGNAMVRDLVIERMHLG
jgi:3-oxoacyl-[acyl-carrier protein] reductase